MGGFEAWLLGYIGTILADQALEIFRGEPLIRELHAELEEWAKGLPEGEKLDSTHALFPSHVPDTELDDRPSLLYLRTQIRLSEIPTKDQWHAALLEQWVAVAETVEGPQEFFLIPESKATVHLAKLANELKIVCEGHKRFFRPATMRKLDEILDLLATQMHATSGLPRRELRLDGSVRTQQEDIEARIAELTEDHEEHEVEPLFRAFANEHDCGYWRLTAGPGMGKTAIMASLSSSLSGRYHCIPYFFRQDRLGLHVNTLAGFYDYVARRLTGLFTIPETGSSIIAPGAAELKHILTDISERRELHEERPLLLIVDALDEMEPDDYQKTIGRDPLLLPGPLPRGVFLAYSRRPDKSDVQSAEPSLLNPQCFVKLEADAYMERHMRTVTRYVTRVCGEKGYITPYHDKSDPQEKSAFIDALCHQANLNFMILRCILNEADYWKSGGTGADLPPDLESYYDQHLVRMTKRDYYGTNAKATFCFALRPNISRPGFMRLLGNETTTESGMNACQTLDEWMAQGLIQREQRLGVDWLSPYHRTYRDFLKGRLDAEDYSLFLVPFIQNLCASLAPDSDFESLLDEAEEIVSEWFGLVIYLLLISERATTLRRYITSLAFWQLAAKRAGGIGAIINDLSRIKPKKEHLNDFEELLDAATKLLRTWTESGSLRKKNGEPYTYAEILRMADHADTARRSDGSLSLVNFL